jgi:hypothetical protein
MASEGRDGRALALSLRVVIAHRLNRLIRVTVRVLRKVQEGPLIFSYCFVNCMDNIAKGSVVTMMDKDGRVVLNRRNLIYEQ